MDSETRSEAFAHIIRQAGSSLAKAEMDLAKADAAEKRQHALLQFKAEMEHGCKSSVSQSRFADSTNEMFEARTQRGIARGALAAAKANLMAAEVEFKQWQSKQALLRSEARVYNA